MEWKPIMIEGMLHNARYEISENGDVRNVRLGRTLKTRNGVKIPLEDGTYRSIWPHKLVKELFENTPKWIPEPIDDSAMTDDVMELICDIYRELYDKYVGVLFDIRYMNTDDMFSISTSKFKYPMSVRKESNGTTVKYIIRTGKHWDDVTYYGNQTDRSNTYYECSPSDVKYVILSIVHKKIYSNPAYKNPRPYNYKPPITKKECEEFCVTFIKNHFHLTNTIKVCKENGIPITYNYAWKIVTKQRFRDISDMYFAYNGDGVGRVTASMFQTCLFGKEYED